MQANASQAGTQRIIASVIRVIFIVDFDLAVAFPELRLIRQVGKDIVYQSRHPTVAILEIHPTANLGTLEILVTERGE